MRIVTYNVNGLRAIKKRRLQALEEVLDALDADIVCMQETKLTEEDLQTFQQLALAEGWDAAYAFHRSMWGRPRLGYSGVATYWRTAAGLAPLAVEEGLVGAAPCQLSGEQPQLINFPAAAVQQAFTPQERAAIDEGGRVVTVDFGALVVFNCYVHSTTRPAEPLFQVKLRLLQALELRVRACLAEGRHVLVTGDLNCSVQPLDHGGYWREEAARKAAYFDGRPDRRLLFSMLAAGGGCLQDCFRLYHPYARQAEQARAPYTTDPALKYRPPFTVWDPSQGNVYINKRNDRSGSRIDYMLAACACQDCGDAGASAASSGDCLWDRLRGCGIVREHPGSDHAPVWLDLDVDPGELRGWGQQQQASAAASATRRPPTTARRLCCHAGGTVLHDMLTGAAALPQAAGLEAELTALLERQASEGGGARPVVPNAPHSYETPAPGGGASRWRPPKRTGPGPKGGKAARGGGGEEYSTPPREWD